MNQLIRWSIDASGRVFQSAARRAVTAAARAAGCNTKEGTLRPSRLSPYASEGTSRKSPRRRSSGGLLVAAERGVTRTAQVPNQIVDPAPVKLHIEAVSDGHPGPELSEQEVE